MVDTEDKRRSVQAYTFGLIRPVPDGSVDIGDQATVAWLYSGLDYEPTGASGWVRRKHRLILINQ